MRQRWCELVCAAIFWCSSLLWEIDTLAQAPSAQSPQVEIYEPGDVQLEASRVYVFVGKTGFGHEHAVTGRLASGNLQLDPATPLGELVFDMSSFDADAEAARKYLGMSGTTDADTRRQVNENMLGEAVLNIAEHPTATFVLTTVEPLKELSSRKLPQYALSGELTLHGAKQPVKIVADAVEKQGWIHLRGEFALEQTAFGMKPFTKAFGAVGVADELRIHGDFWIAKERRIVPQNAKSSARQRR